MTSYGLVIICWIIFSSIFGITDGWYWYSANMGKYGLNSFKFKDLHPYFFWSRTIVGGVFSYSICEDSILKFLLIIICLGLVFPFFHNGFYYRTRNKIDASKYPLGFRDMSTTSIAKINFTFVVRTLMFVIGLLGFSFIYFL